MATKPLAILIPIFNGESAVRRCVESVLRHSAPAAPVYLLDDASTDLGLLAWLDEIESRSEQVQVLRSEVNLGFVGNVNRGLALTAGDVVVLNSDTIVTAGWIEKLLACAESHPEVGLVCPLSNNATILSVPRMNTDEPLPEGFDVERFGTLVEACSVRAYPPLPVAVGFCMLVTRRLIERIGPLHRAYERGYGEECDLSLRAREAGFEIRCCDDTFIYHEGERSFAAIAGMEAVKRRNEAVLLARWPFYDRMIARYCALNPLRATQERIREALAQAGGETRPRMLQVLHAYDTLGGTELHSRSVIAGVAQTWRSSVLFLGECDHAWQDLRERQGPDGERLLEYAKARISGEPRLFGAPASLRQPLVEAAFTELVSSGGYALVHFQHLLGWGSLALPRLAKEASARVVLSLHDYYLCCPIYDLILPEGRRCGKSSARAEDADCLQCLAAYQDEGAPACDLAAHLRARREGVLEALASADAIIAPSCYVRDKFALAYGEALAAKIAVMPHGVPPFRHLPAPPSRPRLHLGIFANLNRRKGAELLLEALAALTQGRGLRLSQFGGVDERYAAALDQYQVARIGVYRLDDLPRLAADVDLALVPSIYEETFCLTIAELQALGIPVIAFAIGAMPERIRDGETGFLVAEVCAAALAARILTLADDPQALRRVRECLREARIKPVKENQREYAQLYQQLLTRPVGKTRAVPSSASPASRQAPADRLMADVLSEANRFWQAGLLGYGRVQDRRWLAHWQRARLGACTEASVREGAAAGATASTADAAALPAIDLVVIERERDAEGADLHRTLTACAACWRAGVRVWVFSYFERPRFADDTGPLLSEVEARWVQIQPQQQFARAINLALAKTADAWLGWIWAGDALRPETIDLVRGYLKAHPQWRFLYSDEDRIAEDGRRYAPCFKPDINLDLLRSTPYVGDLCLIQGDLFRQVGGVGHTASEVGYELCLKALDACGDAAIGHLPQVLYGRADTHTSQGPLQERAQSSVRLSMLSQHLERCQIKARIHRTGFADVYWVDYAAPKTLSVSVILMTHGDFAAVEVLLDQLSAAIEGDVEMLVLDFKRSKGAAGEAAPRLKRRGARRLAALRDGQIAGSLNQAIKAARGDYVLICHDGLRPGAHFDLRPLIGLAARADVGLAAPCILGADGRILYGVPIAGCWPLGATGELFRGQTLSEHGALGRNVSIQNSLTVADQAFVIKRQAFQAVGRFRYRDYPQAWYLLDYGLRLTDAGWRVAWTPHVTLVNAQEGSFERYQRQAADPVKVGGEVAQLYEDWLPRLAADPAYNPKMSLREPGEPEHAVAPCWDRVVDTNGLRCVGFPDGHWASAYYRVIDPLNALHHAGWAHCALMPEPKQAPVPNVIELERLDADVLLLHNALHTQHLHALELYRRYGRVRMIFSLDDLITDLPAWNPFSRSNYPDIEKRLRQQLRLCDRLLVSTPLLAQAYAELVEDVQVVPNRLSAKRWLPLAEMPPAGERPSSRRPRIGWAGAAQHGGDLDWLNPVVDALAEEADWFFFGMCPDALQHRVTSVVDMVPFDQYPTMLAKLDLDVAIAPLTMHDFNRCKSNLKLLEYGVLGISVVCTEIEPYRDAPVERLSNDTASWINALRTRIHDLDATRQEGLQLKRWVNADWILDDQLVSWQRALS